MTEQQRKHTPEYRVEAAWLVIETGRTIAAVVRELGVGEQFLGRWVQAEWVRLAGEPSINERAELKRLRREVEQFRKNNEFLGKQPPSLASKQAASNGLN